MEMTRREFLASSTGAISLPLVGGEHASTLSAPQGTAPKRFIVDTDPGVDDAVSILLALKSPEVRIEALTVVAGNVELDYGLPNALALLELRGSGDVPVYGGASKPLLRPLLTARMVHGDKGMGGVELPPAKAKARAEHAADFIISKVKANPGQLSLVCLGPLTNIAMALIKDPGIAPQIKELGFMGGTILSNGNTTPVATFNIYCDPEAARVVVNSGIPRIYMVGTDVTTKVLFNEPDCVKFDSNGKPESRLTAAVTRYRLRAQGAPSTVGFNDLPAMAAMIRPGLFKFERMAVDIETKGELTTGMTVANRRNRVVRLGPQGKTIGYLSNDPVEPNVDVATGIEEAEVKKLFMERIMN